MRILAGKYKGLEIPSDLSDETRPLTSLLRRSIFDHFRGFIEEKIVYDIFAGSGSFGLEALSNGARKVIFVDSSSKNCRAIKGALRVLSDENGIVINRSYEKIPSEVLLTHPPDLVFLDPPYSFAKSSAIAKDIEMKLKTVFSGNKYVMVYRLFSKVKFETVAVKIMKHGQDSVYFIYAG
jgi:16S rRNA (guanine(966)-N(2))-methyltransferase RsmD